MIGGGLWIFIRKVRIFSVNPSPADGYSELTAQVRDLLREKDSNSSSWQLGEIFHQIRVSTRRGDDVRNNKWLCRLSKDMQRSVLRLEALPTTFVESLDALIPFAGLWPAFDVGTILAS